ncbi:terminase gpA endonuclease subunit [Rhizobium ruizarguesonis]|jgi:phage terminase large subunit GpA-like protein|uniref:terminase gpA endonuclease subunit n=1 Tax=Rhizobium ruizarguesonis TaxID=2081791 RepID=UPI00102F4820|nr:terminase gpA endonuclease subunit [Rhizobium ruizarguesonis]TBA24735.1 hypothetical protein ELH61_02485 [Rhizobium ruizarguesonis]
MPVNFDTVQRDAELLLADVSFSEGLEAFRRLLQGYRSAYLMWKTAPSFADWVFENITLTKQESSRAGPMRLSVYQRAIGHALFHEPDTRQVSVLKGVQIGYSKLLRVIYAYTVAVLQKRVSVVFPTDGDMKRFFKDELSLLHSTTAAVQELLRENKRGEVADSMDEYRYKNGVIAYYRAAFNEDDLQGFTSWLQIADEADRSGWLPRGNSAGDKVSQLRNRGTDFIDSKLIIGSTPGVRDISVIWAQWETSDKRKLFITCPHCRTEQELRWGSDKTRYGFRWKVDEYGHVTEAFYKCDTERECFIREDEKEAVIEAGSYRATAIPTQPGNVGIHAPSWISMSPGAAWKLLAQQWLESQGNPEKLKEFVTFKMAEPWDEVGQGIDENSISEIVKPYSAEVPDDVVLLTAGGDTQKNKAGKGLANVEIPSREFSVVGWTRFGQMRVIGHWVFEGRPGDPSSDQEVRAFLNRQWKRRDGKTMQIMAAAMDSNGGFPDEVRAFCASFPSTRNIWAIIGDNKAAGTRSRYVWPSKANTSRKTKNRYYRIDTGLAKDSVFRLLQQTGDHAPMIPASMPPTYLERLMCEEKKKVRAGYYWQPKRGRRAEEEWVCLAYALAALKGLQITRSVWADLNVAGKDLDIPVMIHDPVTGEIGYFGDDFSALAQERRAAASPLLADSPTPRFGLKAVAQAAVPRAAPSPAQVAQALMATRKRRTGGVVSSGSDW